MTQMHATAYAVVLGSAEHGFSLATLCKTPECAREAVSIFEGMPVLGLATIALEPEPIIGMTYRLRGGSVPAPRTAPLTATPSPQAEKARGESVTLTMRQIHDLASFAGLSPAMHMDNDEGEAEFTICECPPAGVRNEDEPDDPDSVAHYSHVVYCTEYPDEGCMGLGPEIEAPTTIPQPQGDASPEVSGGGESDDEIDARLDALHKRMRESCQHNGGMVGVAWNRAVYRAALSTPRTDEPARPEKALRDALEYVGQRSDGDLATIAERAELWMRESKVLIDHRREPAPTVDGGAALLKFANRIEKGEPYIRNSTISKWRQDLAHDMREEAGQIAHPAPQADVARLVEAAREVADHVLTFSAMTYSPTACKEAGDRLREALAPFTAAQPQEGEPSHG